MIFFSNSHGKVVHNVWKVKMESQPWWPVVCTCCLQRPIPLQWEWHRLLCPPVFAPWPIMETPQEDTCHEEDGQSRLQWQVSLLDSPYITPLSSSVAFLVYQLGHCSYCIFKAQRLGLDGTCFFLPFVTGLNLMCHSKRHKPGSWMWQSRTTRCSTCGRERTLAW